ncbi:MAG TPA: TonB family protein [Candidatus Limnocylindria bacterium]|nr:TonB family protein [Candidatus Limnocylindria bacterium]
MSLPFALKEVYQKFAWADSICLFFLAVGLVGFYQPPPDAPPPPPPPPPDVVEAKELTPDLVQEPPPAPPDQAQPQEMTPPDAPNVEAPAPVPVAELSPAVQFSVPVEGPTTIVPVERAAAPSGNPPPKTTSTTGTPGGTGPAGPALFQQSYGRGGMVAPKYPRDLELQAVEGTVELLLTVDAEGHAVNVDFGKKSGYRQFDQEAMRCAKHPATRFNTSGAGLYRIEVQFTLPK